MKNPTHRGIWIALLGVFAALGLSSGGVSSAWTKSNEVPQAGSTPNGWEKLSRGQVSRGIRFDRDGSIWSVHTGRTAVKVPDTEPYWEQIYLSPLSRTQRFIIVAPDDPKPMEAFVVDRNSGKSWKLNLYTGVDLSWISWSPQDRVAFFGGAFEGGMEFFSVCVADGALSILSRKGWISHSRGVHGLATWGNRREIVRVKANSVKWLDDRNYRLVLEVRCNYFDVQGCDFNRVIRTHELSCQMGAPRCEEVN